MKFKRLLILLISIYIGINLISCDKETKVDNNTNEQVVGDTRISSERNKLINKDNNVGKQAEYKKKLNGIQIGLVDLNALYSGTTIEMRKAADEEYKRWDEALNEIYSELKKDLPKDEMSKLEKEEVKWIKDKEVKAKENSSKFKGGTQETLEYTATLCSLTKERCYELVNEYMK